ncbi:hypothetical protein VTJ04DRAFT_471 [Mycothermus thermophilus]|uniref:uncharacterized protein n=1 Tax=Humicola insolens TaxID=85995 RepID=UPI0037431697
MRLFNIALGVLLALLFPGALGAPEPWLYTTDGYSPTHLKATVCRHAYYSDCIIVGGYPNTCFTMCLSYTLILQCTHCRRILDTQIKLSSPCPSSGMCSGIQPSGKTFTNYVTCSSCSKRKN